MAILLHITDAPRWLHAKARGVYTPPQFETEGFIHCSTPQQVVEVANRLFRGQSHLLLLVIESQRVGAEIRFENLEGGSQLFPHLYGALQLEAVIDTLSFEPQSDGRFVLPPQLMGAESGP